MCILYTSLRSYNKTFLLLDFKCENVKENIYPSVKTYGLHKLSLCQNYF